MQIIIHTSKAAKFAKKVAEQFISEVQTQTDIKGLCKLATSANYHMLHKKVAGEDVEFIAKGWRGELKPKSIDNLFSGRQTLSCQHAFADQYIKLAQSYEDVIKGFDGFRLFHAREYSRYNRDIKKSSFEMNFSPEVIIKVKIALVKKIKSFEECWSLFSHNHAETIGAVLLEMACNLAETTEELMKVVTSLHGAKNTFSQHLKPRLKPLIRKLLNSME